jgi:hypothetical protein
VITQTEVRIHKFEAAGLGKAPYEFLCVTENVHSACPGHQQAGGSCDYCGTGIRYEFHLRSADGKEFKVGSDCIFKADNGDRNFLKIVDRAKKEEAKRKTEAAHKKQDAKINAALEKLSTCRGTLTSLPHPSIPGKTLLDWVNWMLENAGRSGRLRVAAVIEKYSA